MNKLQQLRQRSGLVLGALLLAPIFVFADAHEAIDQEYTAPESPVLPDPVESGEVLEPQVTIIHKDDATITEYRVNGNLYLVKIVPAVGQPYYLIDKDGDGRMESRTNDIYEDMAVPQWVLFSW